MVRLIRYRDIERWKNAGKWVLVYGRRKTGKSFFVKNHVKWDKYYFIGRSREIIEEGETPEKISYEVFEREALNHLKNGKTIVVDEIQRLPSEFYDLLHNLGVKGRLIAISSTLWLSKKLIGEKSPLLGLFLEFPFTLIDERDILINLFPHFKNPKKLIEHAVFLREPWLIPLWESTENFMEALVSNIKISVPSLIGEIFREEERSLSTVYEAILKAVSNGRKISTEITSYLYSLKLIPAQNPSLIHPYLQTLVNIGVLEKVKVFKKQKYRYYHISPVTDLYYYLDSKYGFSEREVPINQALKVLKQKTPFYVEQFMRNLLSKLTGLWKEEIVEKNLEVDIALTDFQKLKLVGEVKWKSRVSKREIKEIEEKLSKFKCRKILIAPSVNCLEAEPESLEVWDVEKLLEKIKYLNAQNLKTV